MFCAESSARHAAMCASSKSEITPAPADAARCSRYWPPAGRRRRGRVASSKSKSASLSSAALRSRAAGATRRRVQRPTAPGRCCVLANTLMPCARSVAREQSAPRTSRRGLARELARAAAFHRRQPSPPRPGSSKLLVERERGRRVQRSKRCARSPLEMFPGPLGQRLAVAFQLDVAIVKHPRDRRQLAGSQAVLLAQPRPQPHAARL